MVMPAVGKNAAQPGVLGSHILQLLMAAQGLGKGFLYEIVGQFTLVAPGLCQSDQPGTTLGEFLLELAAPAKEVQDAQDIPPIAAVSACLSKTQQMDNLFPAGIKKGGQALLFLPKPR
jgi:hypothetical protein